MEANTQPKRLKPWEKSYQPKDYANDKIIAHMRYSTPVGIDQWDVLSAYQEFPSSTTLNEVMKWTDTHHVTKLVSLTISEYS